MLILDSLSNKNAFNDVKINEVQIMRHVSAFKASGFWTLEKSEIFVIKASFIMILK